MKGPTYLPTCMLQGIGGKRQRNGNPKGKQDIEDSTRYSSKKKLISRLIIVITGSMDTTSCTSWYIYYCSAPLPQYLITHQLQALPLTLIYLWGGPLGSRSTCIITIGTDLTSRYNNIERIMIIAKTWGGGGQKLFWLLAVWQPLSFSCDIYVCMFRVFSYMGQRERNRAGKRND